MQWWKFLTTSQTTRRLRRIGLFKVIESLQGSMMSDFDHSTTNLLRSLEEELWKSETRFDPARIKELLADNFLEFGRSGKFYSRADTLDVPSQPIQARIPLPGLEVRKISENVAQVLYNSEVTYGDTIEYARRSSIWVNEEGIWKLCFHQGTPYDPGA